MGYDVIITGGSYAGMSAGLQLARARRKVLVIDGGLRRNRFAATSHGFLGQDGRAPADIAEDARAQLMAYPTVEWLSDTVVQARREEGGFTLETAGGQRFNAQRLLLATGVVDELPAVQGLAERWGKRVFHCPYCHGYELDQGPIGVLATSPMSLHHALMLPDWGPTTFFTNRVFEPDPEQRASLERRGVTLVAEPVERLEGERANVVLEGGRVVAIEGLFVLPRTRVGSSLATSLGCEFEDGPLGAFIQTDMTGETSVPGVFACGDAAMPFGSVALSVGDGVRAGSGVHRSLIFGAH
ncbi:NAD(P)/FAD-dependent oxidoreductase [Pseudomonas fluorescens]|uniref:NAD(P)/FAD-dependent oxidoreductase n=1 Tax=Pseudomonas fluorescens TaxID=294 RepID=A0A944DKH5_PSEFL|nr:NAD(P)/FAD-dependent oxidoreductase [Pseudomonas fluorescens]MBT2295889.1 NAD(P)/FAD-dependent oxidoreductase [Pseudomonas fluorescens]MBT2306146.1 NAD(P)/FAD-dependent oxidoreductase [Pseudomonas fluorescens]MBT2314497.1 NAD(P)/FAD-dependent oxidoreductase [Pseudomonas fluorescens]MBT2315754.1 NAD(P)/FAD-dependent oxidoreductase [Pseudomonas fluorescens]MBT2330359.1 NAD(P)/FAD-dependent oxidoreductase [Pseudomonas fluorescens]